MTAETTPTSAGPVLGDLGAALLDAGYAVTDVERIVLDTADANGASGVHVGVLPTAILVDDPGDDRTRIVPAGASSFTFDQTGAVATAAHAAQGGRIDLTTLAAELADVRSWRPRYGPALVIAGSGLMSGGISIVFRTTWAATIVDLILGMAMGAALVAVRSARVQSLLPFLAAVVSAAVIYGLESHLTFGSVVLYVVAAPLVTLIPGATITNGVLEVAAGDVVSGGGRLMSGFVIWGMLAAGVVAGAALVGTPPSELAGTDAFAAPVPMWAVVPAIAALGLGVGLFFGAERSLIAFLVVSLGVTYGIVAIAQLWTSGPVASGIAAAVMLPVLRMIEVGVPRWPACVTFRPAFWLLVPGSLGLVAISELTAGIDPAAAIGSIVQGVVLTVVGIAVGVQVGALISTALEPGRRGRVPT